MKALVRQVVVAEPMKDVLVRIMAALTPGSQFVAPLMVSDAAYEISVVTARSTPVISDLKPLMK